MEQVLWSSVNKLSTFSDSFTELYNKLKAGEGEYEGADPEDINEYRADIDDAVEAIEKDNPSPDAETNDSTILKEDQESSQFKCVCLNNHWW